LKKHVRTRTPPGSGRRFFLSFAFSRRLKPHSWNGGAVVRIADAKLGFVTSGRIAWTSGNAHQAERTSNATSGNKSPLTFEYHGTSCGKSSDLSAALART
jgi:hypothetical protein